MLRFPNPNSDIDHMIHLFQVIFEQLAGQETITLEDMKRVMALEGLSASCGRMGEEALVRSTRKDKSRDQIYNLAKQYAEVFRLLGWMVSTEDARLDLQFTTLGAFVYEAKDNAKKIAEQCILRIAYPNPVLDVKSNVSIRLFPCILKSMLELDGYMSRDEIIIGPMSIADDRNTNDFTTMINNIREYRQKKDLFTPMRALLKKCGLQYTTSGNYTRMPLAILKWAKWAETERKNVYSGRAQQFYKLTQYGYQFARNLLSLIDIRAKDLDSLENKVKNALIENSFLLMLQKGNFDISCMEDIMRQNELILSQNNLGAADLLFSPFQEISREEFCQISKLEYIFTPTNAESIANQLLSSSNKNSAQLIQKIKLDSTESSVEQESELKEIWDASGQDIKIAVNELIRRHRNDNKDIYYPLVAKLFTCAGYPCSDSPSGSNYQRWDARIDISNEYIPIEIKSPGEEEQVSVKAIRQAAENHIILSSRMPSKTRPELTSLAVCFRYPNKRAEVNDLIHYFYKAFDIKIGVIDLENLATLAFSYTFLHQKMALNDLENLNGFLNLTH